MQTNYCLFIDRRIPDNYEDFTDLPWNNLADLTQVAMAALQIPYVTKAVILPKAQDTSIGLPIWGLDCFMEENSRVEGYHKDEETFKKDLRTKLNNDSLFDRLYQNKAEWDRFVQSIGDQRHHIEV